MIKVMSNKIDSFTSPESSHISGAEYDSSTETVTVTFHHRGKPGSTYKSTKPFPQDVWDAFKGASSKGVFYNNSIQSIYGMVKS